MYAHVLAWLCVCVCGCVSLTGHGRDALAKIAYTLRDASLDDSHKRQKLRSGEGGLMCRVQETCSWLDS